MDIFIKSLENNLDKREIKFHAFDPFLIRKFENKFANQHNSC